MNAEKLNEIVNALLYEGYVLYPYRPSAGKNGRQRFTFGRIYPEVYSKAQAGKDPCFMQTECLAQCMADAARAKISIRFLHPFVRETWSCPIPISANGFELSKDLHLLAELRNQGKPCQQWQEAVERVVVLPEFNLNCTKAEQYHYRFRFAGLREQEPLPRGSGMAGWTHRVQESVEGVVQTTIQPVESRLVKLSIRIFNTTRVEGEHLENDPAVLPWTFVSTHTILQAEGAEFLSMVDPPEHHAALVAQCRNASTWPVLVGDENLQERDTMLSSPIILFDYPQIPPESPGTLSDGSEIKDLGFERSQGIDFSTASTK